MRLSNGGHLGRDDRSSASSRAVPLAWKPCWWLLTQRGTRRGSEFSGFQTLTDAGSIAKSSHGGSACTDEENYAPFAQFMELADGPALEVAPHRRVGPSHSVRL